MDAFNVAAATSVASVVLLVLSSFVWNSGRKVSAAG